jgi:hypothetical protein
LLLLAFPARAAEHVVVIDAGHGGSRDSGSEAEHSLSAANNATSPGGLKEKDLALELALAVRDQIAALARAHPQTQLTCRLTRASDTNPDFAQRAHLCATSRPLPFAIVSLHFNADGGKALGTVAVPKAGRLGPGGKGNPIEPRALALMRSGVFIVADAGSHDVLLVTPGSSVLVPIGGGVLKGSSLGIASLGDAGDFYVVDGLHLYHFRAPQ